MLLSDNKIMLANLEIEFSPTNILFLVVNWLKAEFLEDTGHSRESLLSQQSCAPTYQNLPTPAMCPSTIVEQIEAALEEFWSEERLLDANGDKE